MFYRAYCPFFAIKHLQLKIFRNILMSCSGKQPKQETFDYAFTFTCESKPVPVYFHL